MCEDTYIKIVTKIVEKKGISQGGTNGGNSSKECAVGKTDTGVRWTFNATLKKTLLMSILPVTGVIWT